MRISFRAKALVVIDLMASIEGALGGAFVGILFYGLMGILWRFEPSYRDELTICLVFAAIGCYLF